MSEPHEKAAGEAQPMREKRIGRARAGEGADPNGEPGSGRRLTRRTWTLVLSTVLVVVFAVLGALVQVPYVALGPGPTYDTLSQSDGQPMIQIDGERSYPTTGELRMTTVSLNDEISLFGALGLWASGRYAVAPREQYYKPGETDQQVKQENTKQFKDSQSEAEVAALRSLGYPVKVLAGEIETGSAVDKAGLAAGDRLLEVNGKTVGNQDDVRAALAGTRPNQEIQVTFQHAGGQPTTVSVTLGGKPGRPEGILGLIPVDRADVGFNINIRLQDVGGPSAGLMFALGIIDRMTPRDEVAGEHVAGTGEITGKGEVGAIGGISFKVVAAREAGATAFLTPKANCAEAAAAAPDGLKLLKVSNLRDALSALADLKAGRPAPSC